MLNTFLKYGNYQVFSFFFTQMIHKSYGALYPIVEFPFQLALLNRNIDICRKFSKTKYGHSRGKSEPGETTQ